MPPPASAFKKAPRKDVPLTAVIILDSFDQRFAPILQENQCFGFLPICNIPAINYTFSWLVRTEIKNIMLVVTSTNSKYAENVEDQWKNDFEEFRIISCDGATSIGDCLREIQNRELITSDFLFISNPTAVTSSNLVKQIADFRNRRQENADNVMTLIYGQCENREKSIIGINSQSNKLVLYPSTDNPNNLKTDKPHFLESLQIRRDIVYSGIALCSRLISTQFSDNFDFQTLDDVIRELLSKDDVLGLNVHIDVLPEETPAFQVVDYDSLIHLNKLMLERWFYPITPEKSDLFKYVTVGPRNIYIEEEHPTNSSRFLNKITLNELSSNISLGIKAIISDSAKLKSVSVGEGTVIGDNSNIQNSIIGNNCKIGKNCSIKNVLIGDNVTIEDNSIVYEETIIGSQVIFSSKLGQKEDIMEGAIMKNEVDSSEYEKLISKSLSSHYLWQMSNGAVFWKKWAKTKLAGSVEDSEEDDDRDEDDEDDDYGLGAMDSTKQFYEEVFESMKGMLTLTNQQMSNLILEINSSKLACNVAIDEVARNVFAAFLALPGNEDLKTLLLLAKKWKPLFLNYYKSSEEGLAGKSPLQRKVELDLKRKCQIQMLLAIEDKYDKEIDQFGPKVAKLVHFLYNDVDVLDEEAILEWARSIADESNLKKLMQPIVDWLLEDDEEEEESDDE